MRRNRRRNADTANRRAARRSRSVPLLLLLASLTLITLDARPSGDSPVEPLRSFAGTVFGPLETGAAALTRPFIAVSDYVADVGELRASNERLAAQNAHLRSRLQTSEADRSDARHLDRMLGVSERRGFELLPARVVSIGSAQTFSRTVTIDAGRRDGVVPDLTVLSADGLVGRVIASTRSNATVLLIVDPSSVVGGRLGSTMELGFVRGQDDIGDDGRLELELVDDVATPRPGDTVVTWGSRRQAPYVAGVLIGTVTEVHSSPRELSSTAVVAPVVDFSSLDLVGVVVAAPERDPRARLSASSGAGPS